VLSAAHHPAVRLPVAVLAHGPDAELFPGVGIAAEDGVAGREDAVAKELGRFVEEDDVDPPLRREMGEGGRHARLESSALLGWDLGRREDRHVQVAVRPRAALGAGAEEGEDRESFEVFDRVADRLVEIVHGSDANKGEEDRSASPGEGRQLALGPTGGIAAMVRLRCLPEAERMASGRR